MPKNNKKTKESSEEKRARRSHSSFWRAFYGERQKIWDDRLQHVRLHRSFRRSYREDYRRPINLPGLVHEARIAMRIVLRNWKIFLPLLLTVVLIDTFIVGIMSESAYQTYQDTIMQSYDNIQEGQIGKLALAGMTMVSTIATGGLNQGVDDVQKLISIILIVIVWLCTIYALRQLLAGNKPTFREVIYNSCGPLFSSLVCLIIILIHMVPLFIFFIFYSSAKSTEFLSHPLYAFVFWVFGLFLIVLSLYLLSGSLMGLVATTVPGIYPVPAVRAATDLVQGRRVRVIIRIVFGFLYIAVWWALIMWPLSWLDIVAKEHISWLANVPIMPFCNISMTAFTAIYITSYIYLFYRRMLDND